jgi:hypothetical protein
MAGPANKPFGASPSIPHLAAHSTIQPPILTVRRIPLASSPRYLQTIRVQRLIGRTERTWYG